jgi:glycogen(starch) synthase
MKVLMLGWELPPHNSGGLGVACYQMCKHLSRRNIAIEFVVPYTAAEQPEFMQLHGATRATAEQVFQAGGAYDSYCYSCKTADCEHSLPTDMMGQQLKYTQFVEQLVQNNTYDAIHAHDWLTFQAGMRAKELTGKPLIAHVHATEFDRAGMNRGNELVHQIEYSALLMADAIIAVSQFTKDLIVKKYGIPADKIEVIHNAIDPEEFGTLDDVNAYIYLQKMKQLGYKVVVSLGRLSLQKGITNLLAAAQKVVQKNNKVLFLLVGDGESRNELIQAAAEYGVSQNVIFTGFLRGKKWRDSYAIGDIFVMPSISEPFGLSALEAAGYNNAILLSRQCGVGEVLKNAVQFDAWDTDKLADAIINLAEHDSMQQLMASGAQHEVAKLNWGRAAHKFEVLYQKHAQKAYA